jgi:hypothetical protein
MSLEPSNNCNVNYSPAGLNNFSKGTATFHGDSITQAITNEQLSTCPSSITYKNAANNSVKTTFKDNVNCSNLNGPQTAANAVETVVN